MNTRNLLIYRNFKHQNILDDMTFLMEECRKSTFRPETYDEKAAGLAGNLIDFSENHGFCGNIWHTYLAYLLANNENSYSTSCEITGSVPGSINEIVLHDFAVFQELFHYDLDFLESKYKAPCFSVMKHYEAADRNGKVYNERIRDRICELSASLASSDGTEEFKDVLTQFYKEFGVGRFGLHKAFRVVHTDHGAKILPITKIAHVRLDDLIGYEIPKKKLRENTEAFVHGRKANNCILYGDAGTGKSSSCKAILNEYYDDGLRMIEIYRYQFQDLNDVIDQIKNRNYKFIIYMDDLSFEDFETEYKYLKAVIEGGLERRPDNVLIYATSNRRHLIREQFTDKEGRRNDLHASDTVQEKLSLSARFGVSIFFNGPDKEAFNQIVLGLARRNHIMTEEEELLDAANKWELAHGGLSGRTAQQFIDYLMGKEQ